VQRSKLSIQGEDLLLSVSQGKLGLQELCSNISQLGLQLFNIDISLGDFMILGAYLASLLDLYSLLSHLEL